ncbi:hypothetical protein ACOZ38_04365 [Sphaerisporangium viridialbum]
MKAFQVGAATLRHLTHGHAGYQEILPPHTENSLGDPARNE